MFNPDRADLVRGHTEQPCADLQPTAEIYVVVGFEEVDGLARPMTFSFAFDRLTALLFFQDDRDDADTAAVFQLPTTPEGLPVTLDTVGVLPAEWQEATLEAVASLSRPR